jgi:hypothetical protein
MVCFGDSILWDRMFIFTEPRSLMDMNKIHLTVHVTEVYMRGGIHNFRDWCCFMYSICSSAMQRQMIVLGVSVNIFTQLDGRVGFTSFYLESCIRPDGILRWI